MVKKALISGITGQDGAYLSKLLLEKGYEVHGIKRRASSFNTSRVDPFYQDPHEKNTKFILHYGDLTDSSNVIGLMQKIKPDEVYHLGAQSHVQVSFEMPEYTANVDALGTLRFLEAIRLLGMEKDVRFYQASTSELYGKVVETPQSESTPFYPRSPYGAAKLYAYWITKNYREAYDIFASNGILFNHESPLRGETFVTRKITRSVARIKLGMDEVLYLGNLNAERDWGHAKEYVEGMWRILQHKEADDFVLASGKKASVRNFVQMAFEAAGIQIKFEGSGLDEIGICADTGKIHVRIDAAYYRPSEVEVLIGDATKAKNMLGWSAQTSLESLCQEMVFADIHRCKQEIQSVKNLPKNVEYLIANGDEEVFCK